MQPLYFVLCIFEMILIGKEIFYLLCMYQVYRGKRERKAAEVTEQDRYLSIECSVPLRLYARILLPN